MRYAFLICIVVAVCGGGLWFLATHWPKGEALITATTAGAHEQAPELKAHRAPPQGQKEFYSERFRISFFYPEDLELKIYEEGAGAATVVLQNVANPNGFQIFILPYTEPTVTEERFRKDSPLGVREDPQQVTIAGAPGLRFFGQDVLLGRTAEVWILHNRYLYEVSTLEPLSPLLNSVMQSWQFL